MRDLTIVLLAAIVVAPSTAAAAAPPSRGEGWFVRHRPTRGLAELGIHGGAFIPRNHELYNSASTYEPLRRVGPEFGVRFGFYPLRVLGLELESAVMPTRTTISDAPATVVGARAHLIAQLPYRLTPFILVGVGLLIQTSRRLGTDLDPGPHFGGGLKLFLTPLLALRLDLRSNIAAQAGTTGGRTQHLETLLGISVTLGRPAKPRPRAPGPQDRCQDSRATTDGCPTAGAKPRDARP
jgi:hypothetical protein